MVKGFWQARWLHADDVQPNREHGTIVLSHVRRRADGQDPCPEPQPDKPSGDACVTLVL